MVPRFEELRAPPCRNIPTWAAAHWRWDMAPDAAMGAMCRAGSMHQALQVPEDGVS